MTAAGPLSPWGPAGEAAALDPPGVNSCLARSFKPFLWVMKSQHGPTLGSLYSVVDKVFSPQLSIFVLPDNLPCRQSGVMKCHMREMPQQGRSRGQGHGRTLG